MFPRFTSSLSPVRNTYRSLFRNTYRLARQRSRLTLGVAAATLAVVVGVLAGVLAGSTSPARAVTHPGAISHAVAVRPAGHAGATTLHFTSRPAPDGHAVSAHSRQHAADQHPAKTQRHTQPQNLGPVKPARPYSIYDSVTPSAIPAHHEIATYATGNFAVPASQVAGRGPVLWIDTNGTDPAASVLDVEPGDATPSGAASWALHKLNDQPNSLARIYTMRSEWSAVQAAVGKLPSQIRSHVHYWIADPTGVPHLVPGSDATQWYWGAKYDITTATSGF